LLKSRAQPSWSRVSPLPPQHVISKILVTLRRMAGPRGTLVAGLFMRGIGTANIIVCGTRRWRCTLRACLMLRRSGVDHHYMGRGGCRLFEFSRSVGVLAPDRQICLLNAPRFDGRVLGDSVSGGRGRPVTSFALPARHESRQGARCTDYKYRQQAAFALANQERHPGIDTKVRVLHAGRSPLSPAPNEESKGDHPA
jgi:hypothetical protein